MNKNYEPVKPGQLPSWMTEKYPQALALRNEDGTTTVILNPELLTPEYYARVRKCMVTAANNLLDQGIIGPPPLKTSHSEEEQQAS